VRALVSAQGPSARLYTAALDGRFKIVLSPNILRELRRILLRPNVRKRFPIPLEELVDLIADLHARADIVRGALEVHQASRDPKDNMVLACAIEGRADYLVTDDRRDLLPMKHYHGVQIVSVPGFLRILRGR
jgi:putative PIN family toxin of toxin-antitoxin system